MADLGWIASGMEGSGGPREFPTAGETICQRPLEKEVVAGVSHFSPGQHFAEVVEEDHELHAVLSYVSSLGNAVLVLCRRGVVDEEECLLADWEPFGFMLVAGVYTNFGTRPLPEDFELSEDAIAALNAAEQRWCEEQGLG